MGLESKFDVSELTIRDEVKTMFGGVTKLYSTPITPKENTLRLYQGKTPMWAPFSFGDTNSFMISCDPENQARGPKNKGGIDGYGIEWVFVDQVGGAIVKPGNPKIKDINHWEDYVTIPDPDTWDWEGCYNETAPTLREDRAVYVAVPGCLFERLIAGLDCAEALVALVDEDQQEGVHRFFRAVTEVHKKTYKNLKKWFNPDIVNFNDDWGTQRAPFFSNDTYREMIFPYVKEILDYGHSLGFYHDLHSCGFVEPFVPFMIEEGFNSWGGQRLNDKAKLKQMYDHQMYFTANLSMEPDASEEEVDAVVEEFINGIGADNRVLVEAMGPPSLKEKLYIATRKNFDRLVEEGQAIL